MADVPAPAGRCGIDTVEIARIERLLAETPAEDLTKLFSDVELADSGDGPGRAASLAARFAAKEACLKLFPREAALGAIVPADFSIARDNYGAPRVVCGPRAEAVLGRHRIASIAVSMTHDRGSASAVAQAERAVTKVPFYGRFLYRFLPFRRAVVLENLRLVYGDNVPEEEIERLAQAHYGHLLQLLGEFIHHRFMSAERKASLVRVENYEAFSAALQQGKGVLDPHRPFRQLGSGDDRRAREISVVSRQVPLRPPRVQAALARRVHHAPVPPGRFRRDRQARIARPDPRPARRRRRHRLPVRPARRAARRHRGRILLAPGLDVPEPRDHRARHRRAGAVRRRLARGRTSTTCCASAIRSRRSKPRTRTKRSASRRAPTTPCSSASSSRGPSNGTGCIGAGRRPQGKSRKRRLR